MVVRSLITGVINRVPIINQFTNKLEQSEQQQQQQRVSSRHSNTTSTSSDEDFYDQDTTDEFEDEEEEDIKPINIQSLSPKDKIHSKLINNRQSSSPIPQTIPEMTYPLPLPNTSSNTNSKTNSQDDQEFIFDSPSKSRVSSIDKSNILPVSTRLNKRKNQSNKIKNPFATSSTTISNGSSAYTSAIQTSSESEEEENEEIKVKQYLNDQNSKFNDLINNNIDVVLNEDKSQHSHQNQVQQQQIPSTPTQLLFKMAYDNKGAIANSIYQYGKQQISSKLPYIPIINPKTNDQTPKVEEIDNFITPKLGSPLLDNNSELIQYDRVYEDNTSLTQQNIIDQQHFDHLMNNLDDEIKIDIFLDSLDRETKLNLFKSLRKDLNIVGDDIDDYSTTTTTGDNIRNLYYNSNMSTIDKFQMFIIVSIKLFITGIKLFIPITKYIIYKFQKNDLFIFNSKNLNKFIDFILKFMNFLDLKLNSNEKILNKISNHDYIQTEENFEELVNDFTLRTKNMFKPNFIKDKFISKDDLLKRNLYDYFISNSGFNFDTTTENTINSSKNYENDPKYSIYYKNNNDYNLNSFESNRKTIKNQRSIPNLKNSSPNKNSNNDTRVTNDENISFMEVADKFINQLESGV
ncbi:uncharacterized protein KGF55_003502 [Candida pseudojiufengensis]|uniref:uncharacterized protein n=1 Tax=Candida pseudojiufengensis TaxID=497109 RepID=UPI002224E7EB|nr:uncharacterized protein KGF55_003502 [Candida pseudojiufengensis]KAI5962426.1 hypothetical protein KGF55_003502 [Candida pseudojiufengensis]